MKYHNFWKEKPPLGVYCMFAARMPLIKPGGASKVRIRFAAGMYNGSSLIDPRGCIIDPYEFDQWITFKELDEILMDYETHD
jgi:hypothetical protein